MSLWVAWECIAAWNSLTVPHTPFQPIPRRPPCKPAGWLVSWTCTAQKAQKDWAPKNKSVQKHVRPQEAEEDAQPTWRRSAFNTNLVARVARVLIILPPRRVRALRMQGRVPAGLKRFGENQKNAWAVQVNAYSLSPGPKLAHCQCRTPIPALLARSLVPSMTRQQLERGVTAQAACTRL